MPTSLKHWQQNLERALFFLLLEIAVGLWNSYSLGKELLHSLYELQTSFNLFSNLMYTPQCK